jgi:WD40 repeat protein
MVRKGENKQLVGQQRGRLRRFRLPCFRFLLQSNSSLRCSFVVSGSYDGTVSVRPVESFSSSTAAKSAQTTTKIEAHAGAVSSVSLEELSASATSNVKALLATAGHDGVGRLWTINSSGKGLTISQYGELNGARAALKCLRLNPSTQFAAGVDAGGNVLLWAADRPEPVSSSSDSAAPKGSKRARKGSADSSEGSSSSSSAAVATVETRKPLSCVLAAHRGAATGVAWLSSSHFATCGLDGYLRVWSVEEKDEERDDEDSDDEDEGSSGKKSKAAASSKTTKKSISCTLSHSLYAGKAALSVTASPLGSQLASSHADGCVRIWDWRGASSDDASGSSSSSISNDEGKADGLKATLQVHLTTTPASAKAASTTIAAAALAFSASSSSGGGIAGKSSAGVPDVSLHDADSTFVSCVSWCPSSGHHVAVSSYTGVVSVWDVRSPAAPLFVVPPGHQIEEGGSDESGKKGKKKEKDGSSSNKHAKALAVAWAGAVEKAEKEKAQAPQQLLVSGGSDKMLRSAVMTEVLQ